MRGRARHAFPANRLGGRGQAIRSTGVEDRSRPASCSHAKPPAQLTVQLEVRPRSSGCSVSVFERYGRTPRALPIASASPCCRSIRDELLCQGDHARRASASVIAVGGAESGSAPSAEPVEGGCWRFGTRLVAPFSAAAVRSGRAERRSAGLRVIGATGQSLGWQRGGRLAAAADRRRRRGGA